MSISRISPLLLIIGLAACGQGGADQNALVPVARLPDQLCQQATQGMEQLKQSGGFVSSTPGEATLDEEVWMRMDEGQREQMLKLVAYDAACKAEEPAREQSAVIRSEYGRVLSERVVETSADLSQILKQ
jgi:hypothetical protein